MIMLPEQYVVEKFCQYTGYPKYNKRAKTWTGGCPICREGNSWGKKRRLYYKLDKNYVVCFNCGWKGSTLDYVKYITGMDFKEIIRETETYDTTNISNIIKESSPVIDSKPTPSLPADSINLLDHTQTEYWLNESESSTRKVVQDALNLVKQRLLSSSINRPKSLWLSLTDFTHKNRIVLPFFDQTGKIIFYQTRSIYSERDRPKYLSKAGSIKSIFNINQINPNIDTIFLFEGPIDSCFVQNGVGVAGITNGPGDDLNKLQVEQLNDYRLYEKIWVLDSQWLDETSYNKSKLLIDQGHKIFIWPETIGTKYKDLNEMCVDIQKPGIGYKYILKNSHSGLKARLLLQDITTNR